MTDNKSESDSKEVNDETNNTVKASGEEVAQTPPSDFSSPSLSDSSTPLTPPCLSSSVSSAVDATQYASPPPPPPPPPPTILPPHGWRKKPNLPLAKMPKDKKLSPLKDKKWPKGNKRERVFSDSYITNIPTTNSRIIATARSIEEHVVSSNASESEGEDNRRPLTRDSSTECSSPPRTNDQTRSEKRGNVDLLI